MKSVNRIVSGILGLIILLVLVWLGGEDGFGRVVSAKVGYVILAFLATAILTAGSAWRWGMLSGMFIRKTTSWLQCYRSFIFSRVFGLLVPQSASDFGVRPVIHRLSTGDSVASSFGGVTVERVADASLIVAVGIPAVLYLLGILEESLHWWLLATVLTLWVIAFSILGRRFLYWLAFFCGILAERAGKENKFKANVKNLLSRLQSDLEASSGRSSVLWRAAVLSVFRYLMIATQFILINYALDLDQIDVIQIVTAVPLAQLLAIVAFTPGGIGFVEGGFLTALSLMDVPQESVTTFLVGQRVIITVFIIALGILVLAGGFVGPYIRIFFSSLFWSRMNNRELD